MIGVIIGDIVGSRFEFDNYKGKDFELFADGCEFTDDTIMTLAVGKALIESKDDIDFSDEMKVIALVLYVLYQLSLLYLQLQLDL